MKNKILKNFVLSSLLITSIFSGTVKADEKGTVDVETKKEKIVYSFTTKDKAEEIVGKLKAGKKYILREKKAKEGYKKAKDIEFIVRKDGVEQEIKVINEKINEEPKKEKTKPKKKEKKTGTPKTNLKGAGIAFSVLIFVSGVAGALVFLKKRNER